MKTAVLAVTASSLAKPLLKPSLLALAMMPVMAFGCADGCGGVYEIDLTSAMFDCEAGQMPFLSPANDTRINLALLLADKKRFDLNGLITRNADSMTPSSASIPFSTYSITQEVQNDERTATATAKSNVEAQQGSIHDQLLALGLNDESLARFADAYTHYDDPARCVSNTVASVDAFSRVVLAEPDLSDADRTGLIQRRWNLLENCRVGAEMTGPVNVQGLSGKAALETYLDAITAFYGNEQALWTLDATFDELAKSTNAWVAEASRYMQGRVALNRAQVHAVGDYGFFDVTKVDQDALSTSKDRFEAYLAQYPEGRYAESAKGLFRRITWQRGDKAALARESHAALDATTSDSQTLKLLNEIDNKLWAEESALYPGASDFNLVQDLRWLRSYNSSDTDKLAPQEINYQASQKLLSEQDAAFIRTAQRYYVGKDYQAVISTVPDLPAEGPLDVRAFSTQILKGLSLMSLGKWSEAEAHWNALHLITTDALQSQVLQIAQAMTYERSHELNKVFAADSWITHDVARRFLIRNIADEDTLLGLVKGGALNEKERNTAYYTLLYKELTRGRYKDFLRDSTLLDLTANHEQAQRFKRYWQSGYDATMKVDDLDLGDATQYPGVFLWEGQTVKGAYQCESLADNVKRLINNSNDTRGLNCLGEFYLRNGISERVPYEYRPAPTALGGTEDQFGDKPTPRLDLYLKVIDYPRASDNDRGYALYRAVRCFATSGYNSCSQAEIPQSQRKAWFTRLKKDYGSTPWAKALKYYW
ncbi:hypothetical protein ACKC9G_00495 [Pokkaliibacter sp. CJK22405]|uniref:hypothetical protein n=1 Tax=Pokkaliibacter sp. CJK22405 TaxID=3384615 RepID=UPI0039851801